MTGAHSEATTTKNTVISPDFLVWKFCGKAQFPHIARNYAETVPFHKIFTPGNQVKLRYFSKCTLNKLSKPDLILLLLLTEIDMTSQIINLTNEIKGQLYHQQKLVVHANIIKT